MDRATVTSLAQIITPGGYRSHVKAKNVKTSGHSIGILRSQYERIITMHLQQYSKVIRSHIINC